MQTSLAGVKKLCGAEDYSVLKTVPARAPFDEQICAFLHEVSGVLRRMPQAKAHPDVVTYGFFCRKGNIQELKKRYEGQIHDRVGRGVTFHIAPSNVPINFAYSLTAALLAGNISVVKASSKDFPQTRIVCDAYNQVLNQPEYASLQLYINVVIYDRAAHHVTDTFSSMCNFRIIWGGNETVERVREAKIPPRSLELTFADRYSIAVLDAKAINSAPDLRSLAHEFYNDTYLYDQNACSSPQLMLWIGSKEETDRARERFWDAVLKEIRTVYPVEPVTAVNKLMVSCRAAIGMKDVKVIPMPDNRISRIELAELNEAIPEYRCAGGSFLEYCSNGLSDLAPIVTEAYQTIAYFGLKPKELRQWVVESGLRGVDRIVPIGKTANWDLSWDGNDLIYALSRKIAIM